MKSPNVYNLKNLIFTTAIKQETMIEIDGKWVPARPLGYPGLKHRFKVAWLVFTGKADAVI